MCSIARAVMLAVSRVILTFSVAVKKNGVRDSTDYVFLINIYIYTLSLTP